MNNERLFLSCDWGTTAFRIRLVNAESLAILEEENSAQGIAQTFQLWKKNGSDEKDRVSFYLDIISHHITAIAERSGRSLSDVPVMISGMASSTIGMIELPYQDLPVSVTGANFKVHCLDAKESFKHQVIIISGLRTSDDVMRGEETKLVGCASYNPNSKSHIYIFPGTHPKHAEVKKGEVKTFKTYMTGEFFELLSKKSILSVSMEENEDFQLENNLQSFKKGVSDSLHVNLLHSSFLVRTNELFNKLTPKENYHYLSGLLIGTELQDLIGKKQNITVVANAALSAKYPTALGILNLPLQGAVLTQQDADAALIKGQSVIYKKVMADS